MPIDLSTLNESQHAAVMWQDGPLLVLAGPGSGKTRVLTYRIARLIEETPDARFRVLGITFTNKAAAEMRNRIDGLLTDGRERVLLTTFHAFAAEILRQHGSHIGLKPDFGILSEQGDREAVLADAITAALSPDEEFKPNAAQLLPVVDRMLDKCVLPEDAERRLGKQPHAREVAAVYVEYRAQLINANQLDFGSLLAISVDLLEKKPVIAKQIRRVYSYVCVDECQDTNSAQFRLLIQLVPENNPNLFVVADDDQVIYQWNGANPARLQDLRSRFGMQVIQLPENYRCPPEVIALANNLIRHNGDRAAGKQPLLARKTNDGVSRVTVKRFDDFAGETAWLSERLSEMPAEERPQCVVLARRKRLLEDAVKALASNSIPAYVAIRKNEFQSAPYYWLHAMLRLANAPQDREQLRRVSRAFFQLEGVNIDVEDVIARAAVDQGGFLRAWFDVADARDSIESTTQTMLGAARRTLLDRLDYWTFVTAAHDWFKAVRSRPLNTSDSSFVEYEDEKEIWEALKSEIAGHYTLSDLSLHNFLQELDLRAKEKPAPKDAVRCLTIATSKGMEFRHVFLIGLVEDELPSYHARKKGDVSDEMREERRNCFVAITRAEETLTLTYADKYFGWGKEPSRFLKEMELPLQ
ncbi:MAG: ATP-dependent helicase [Acidobacteria bacterium]|nr:ATP-dependent helicase [Acidobacteriota bacterium]